MFELLSPVKMSSVSHKKEVKAEWMIRSYRERAGSNVKYSLCEAKRPPAFAENQPCWAKRRSVLDQRAFNFCGSANTSCVSILLLLRWFDRQSYCNVLAGKTANVLAVLYSDGKMASEWWTRTEPCLLGHSTQTANCLTSQYIIEVEAPDMSIWQAYKIT